MTRKKQPPPPEPKLPGQSADSPIDPQSLAFMRAHPCATGQEWYAFQNADLGSYDVGRQQYVKCGPGCGIPSVPRHAPDTQACGLGWRYLLAGIVDVDTGLVRPIEKGATA